MTKNGGIPYLNEKEYLLWSFLSHVVTVFAMINAIIHFLCSRVLQNQLLDDATDVGNMVFRNKHI